jgi:Tfp pilus assembly protein FimT
MIASSPNSQLASSRRGFALVVTLVMVALMAVIAVGVFTSVSLERATATSYNNRYQAELAVQNGLQAAAKTLAATPTGTNSITGTDTFLVVRADGTADANGNKPAYYYLAKPAAAPAPPSITYYPLFSSSTDPNAAVVQTQPINLAAPFAPAVPAPAPPADSSPTDSTAAWDAAKAQRLPKLYSWQQPSPSPSGPSVKWVEMSDPQDTATAPAHNLPYTRYAYWAEDLDGYLDASQVGGQARASGTSPQEIAMFTVFDPTLQTDPNNTTAASSLINNRPLLFTVPTLQQIAQQAGAPVDVTGPNLAVRLGIDTAEQNLVPLGYGYGSEGQPQTTLNPLSQLRGNIPAKFATPLGTAMPNFKNRTTQTTNTGIGHSGVVNYLSNLAANIVDYASPQNAPTDFMPPGNPNAPPAARGVGAYPFVTSLYDLNNWVSTYGSNDTFTYHVIVEVKTYVQLWNPHNVPVTGSLIVHYQNSDQVNLVDPATGVNRSLGTLTSPPDATIIFQGNTDPVNPDPNKPVITSPLAETANVGVAFNYQITATNGPNQYRALQPNAYKVVVLPAPGSAPLSITGYGASGLPPGLTLQRNGNNAGQISGTPTTAGTYNVTISATNSSGTTSATLVITIN